LLFIIQAYVIIAQSRDIFGSGTLPQDEDILDGSWPSGAIFNDNSEDLYHVVVLQILPPRHDFYAVDRSPGSPTVTKSNGPVHGPSIPSW